MFPDEREFGPAASTQSWNYEPSPAEVFEQLTAPIYTTDADGWLTYYNDAAARLWGYRPVLGEARWCGAWRLYDHEGADLPHETSPMAETLRGGEVTRGQQILLEKPDGTRVPVMTYPAPLRDASGKVVAGFSVILPVSSAPTASLSSGHIPERPRAVPRHRNALRPRERIIEPLRVA
ncbi:PAS domain-containing protein [Methylobacterium sp. CM6257]|jgi:PAS domain S-box-containing protein